jgi:hypothetical protein
MVGPWRGRAGTIGGRRVTVGDVIKRVIPLDFGGWAGSIGNVRRMPEVWPLAVSLLRWPRASGGAFMSGMPENLLASEFGLEKS